MALTYRIVRAEADSDFGKIRQLYYETWQSAYRDLMPASYLQQLTPATWRPEQRWQNMLLKLWVFAHLLRPSAFINVMDFTTLVRFMSIMRRFVFCMSGFLKINAKKRALCPFFYSLAINWRATARAENGF